MTYLAIDCSKLAQLANRKAALHVEHIGELLLRHESHCADRMAEEKVSPGVRFGFWWLNFTGNRRFSVTALERRRLLRVDEFGRDGWGRAMWPEWQIKGGAEFWLPLHSPKKILSIVNFAISDYAALVSKSRGRIWPTKWVFAGTRPGLNSNTFVQAALDAVPELRKILPPTAISKDFPHDGRCIGITPSRTGVFGTLAGSTLPRFRIDQQPFALAAVKPEAWLALGQRR